MTEFKRASCYPDSPLLRDIARELVRMGQLLRGALVQQTIEGMQRAVTITAGDHEVTLRPTGTEQGA